MEKGYYDIQQYLEDYADHCPDKEIRIINAAINAFSEKGFEATRTKEIAQRAGIAEGTIFRYFPTKDAILERMVPLLIRVMQPKISGPIDQILARFADAPVERIFSAILVDRIQMVRDNARFIKSVLPELIHRAPLLNQLRQSILPMIEQYIAKIVEYGKSRGELDDALEPRLVMLQLMGTVVSYNMFGGGDEADVERDVAAYLHNAMTGWNKKCKR